MSLLHKDAKIELLKRVPLFAGLSKDELAEVASLADELELPDARDLTHEGESGREFLVMVEGTADVLQDGNVVNELGPGDFLGEVALVTGEPRTATVRTHGPSRLLVMSAPAFRTLMHDVSSIDEKVNAALESYEQS